MLQTSVQRVQRVREWPIILAMTKVKGQLIATDVYVAKKPNEGDELAKLFRLEIMV